MNLILSLAFKNLTRNVGRNLITSVAVIAGCAMTILGYGFIDGVEENMKRSQIDLVSGHVLLHPPEYPDLPLKAPVDILEPVPDALLLALDDYTWTQRLRFDMRLINGPESLRAKGIGIDLERDDAVFPKDSFVLDGRWPEPGEQALVLGSSVAKLMQLEVGQQVMMETRTSPGAMNALAFTVTGVVDANNPAVNAAAVFLPLSVANELVQAPGPSDIALRIDSRRKAQSVADALPSDWKRETYLEAIADLLELQKIRKKALGFMVFMIMGIAATGIANTVIMAAYERVREVGTLMALGMSRKQVRQMFVLEGFGMGLLASIAGCLLGGAATYWWSVNGIDLSAMGAEDAYGEIAFSLILYTEFNWGPTLFALVFGVVVASLASLYPAVFASRMNPANAVRAD